MSIMSNEILLISGLVGLALIFDFLNGFHDSANSIATIVSTRTLKPHWAVIWAAFFNFIAFLFFKLHVADTMGTGLIDPSIVDKQLIFTTLCGAIFWNVLTWYYGIPSSSSHALIGALVGASIAKAGFHSIQIAGISKVVASIFLSPMLGFILGLVLMYSVTMIFFHFTRAKVDRWFQRVPFFFFGVNESRTWRERRSKNHGYYRYFIVLFAFIRTDILCANLGYYHL